MNKAFPKDSFDRGIKSGVKLDAQVLKNKGIPEDMANTIEKHLNYWIAYKEKDVIRGGGPFLGFSKAIIIIDADSKDEVKRLIDEDPYTIKGVFKDYAIYQWFQAI